MVDIERLLEDRFANQVKNGKKQGEQWFRNLLG